MKRFFFLLAAILAIISYSNIVTSQEAGEVTTTLEVKPEEAQATQAVPEEKSKASDEILLIDDSLPENSVTKGIWNWDNVLKCSGERSHTEPANSGIAQHSYRSTPIKIPKGTVIEQYVYLDPNEIPKGIMLKFSVENGTNGGEIGVYWEGEEEVFVYNNDEPMLYYGVLPNAGRWEKLEVYSEDLGLEGIKLSGISFITYGGKANWDLTKIRPIKEDEGYPQEEELPAEEIEE